MYKTHNTRGSISKIFAFLLFIILLFSSYCAVIREYKIARFYKITFLKKILSSIDVTNGNSLYHSQQFLMIPTLGAFKLDKKDDKKMILKGLLAALGKIKSLDELRRLHNKGEVTLERFLLDPERSGPNSRFIFPVKSSDGKIIDEGARLPTLQFSYLLSFVLKNIFQSNSNNITDLERHYANKSFHFLLSQIIKAYWLDVEAWHWVEPNKNMKARTIYRLNWQNFPKLQAKSYYKAFFDEDYFLFAIAADLLYLINTHGNKLRGIGINFKNKDLIILEEIRDFTLKVMRQRTDLTNGFSFQKTVWADHPDYLYAGCYDNEYPSNPCPKKDVSPDTSHFSRFPWWLRSFRDSWPKCSREYRYYLTLLEKLSEQFISKIVQFQGNNGVLLTNYIDGSNGWYRVGYYKEYEKFGYGPYELSLVAVMGSYNTLAEFNPEIKRFNRCLSSLLKTHNEIKKLYYNEKYPTTFTKFLIKTGLFKQRYQIYTHYCKIIKHLGWK